MIDEDALLEGLRSGRIAGAALDTLRCEPPTADDSILQFQQVIATPHTGAHTDDATHAMGRTALNECLAVLRGEARNPSTAWCDRRWQDYRPAETFIALLACR